MELIPRPDLEAASFDVKLFSGCALEAQRAETVSLQLEGLGLSLNEASVVHMELIINEMHWTAAFLRELADYSQIHQDRIPIVLNHLNIVLPCLSRTLRDIQRYVEDRSMTKRNRWRTMYHDMKDEADGIDLAKRFRIYKYFLTSLRDVLIRSPQFDLNGLEDARITIMALREQRGMPPPPEHVGPVMLTDYLAFDADPNTHWATEIFTTPLSSRTLFKKQYHSQVTGALHVWGQTSVPRGSKILFRRNFNNNNNNNTISLTAYDTRHGSCLLLRLTKPETGDFWFSSRGIHEINIERDGPVLRLLRWSRTQGLPKLWAALNFMTYEELILAYCCLLVLKVRDERCLGVDPQSYIITGERKLFQAKINDDGFWHCLIVYKDAMTGGVRLLAAAWNGELVKCPVWTAFVTHQASSPSWIVPVGRKKIRLQDLKPYIFCQEYSQERMRKGQGQLFEIHFATEEACSSFQALFPLPPKRPKTPQLTR